MEELINGVAEQEVIMVEVKAERRESQGVIGLPRSLQPPLALLLSEKTVW